MRTLIKNIAKCEVCLHALPHGVNPVVQLNANSKILIIGQAPGRKVHESGIPWKDKSGETLRKWLDVSEEQFYDSAVFSIMPMGFCYPGKGKSGDLAPRKECAPLWHAQVLKKFKSPPLILLIGQYAQRYYLHERSDENLTATVRNFKSCLPRYFPLPHPSPRNGNWVKVNKWFEKQVLPELRKQVLAAIMK
jgi:uracil-DNA glycosylase family 4